VILDGLYASNQCQGTPISNPAGGGDNNQNVVVGQLIQFTACIPQAGVSIASSSWSVNDGQFTDKATAGFNPVLSATNTSAPYQPVIATTTCNPNQSYCDYGVGTTSTGFSASGFYFVTQGTYTFTFTYQLNNGTPSVSASVTYVVTGPTAIGDASGTYGPGQQLVCQDSYLLCTTSGETEQLENRFGNGYYLDFSGISFSNHSSAPSGSSGAYQFIQVLAPRLVRYLDSAGVRQPCQTPSGQLDVTYPYATYSRGDELAVDAPGVPLMYDCDW
jgi:hypothetical protein